MFDFDQWQKCTLWKDRSSEEINMSLFPKLSDRAADKAMQERLASVQVVISTEEPPIPKERNSYQMMALLFPARRAQAPVEVTSLFVERRRRVR